MEKKAKSPKIVSIDIENTPLISYTWGIWEQDVIEVKEEWYLLSCGYKWLDEKGTHVLALPQFKNWKKDKKDDSALVKAIWDILNEADVVIAHNGNSHDIKKIYSRFVQHGLPPPKPFKQVDTLLIARRHFKFDSNKLDRLGQYLNVGRKLTHEGFSLWLGCMQGDMASWKKMIKYNKQDVILLEKVYKALLPYITNHPNLGIIIGERSVCPYCGSKDLQSRGVNYGKRSWFCKDCRSWHTSSLKEGSQVR
jgi:hypothetical protein